MIELTDKMIEAMTVCNPGDCENCEAVRICAYSMSEFTRELARELQAERAKPKDDLWKDAPELATVTYRVYANSGETVTSEGIRFFRELPKTRAREIVEETAYRIRAGDLDIHKIIDDHIESAILKAQAEWEAGR